MPLDSASTINDIENYSFPDPYAAADSTKPGETSTGMVKSIL